MKRRRLKIAGAVSPPFEIGYAALLAMEMRTLAATLKCAGNGRAFLQLPPDATLWELGAVGNTEWTGVPLSAVLKRTGITAEAVDIIFEGADHGEAAKPPRPAGALHYARSVPRRNAHHAVLLAPSARDQCPRSDPAARASSRSRSLLDQSLSAHRGRRGLTIGNVGRDGR